MDLSRDVPVEEFEELISFLAIDPAKWDQTLWDIRQALVRLDEIYDGS